MIASSGTTDMVTYFMKLVHKQNSMVVPKHIISDRDFPQINGCSLWYPEALILLCWWHVLHAWQQHFVISQHKQLWEKLKAWIRINNTQDFDATWVEIQALAPADFLAYLMEYWMPPKYVAMWSAVYRQGRSIFEISDTNMLVEA